MFANLTPDQIIAVFVGVAIYSLIVAVGSFVAALALVGWLDGQPTETFDESMDRVPNLTTY